MPRPVDATLHGAVDCSAGATLLSAFPKLAGIEGTRAARQIRTAGAGGRAVAPGAARAAAAGPGA